MADHRDGFERGAWRRIVERLAHLPRPAHFFRFALNVATRHVEPDAITEAVIQRFFHRNIRTALADGHYHFDLMVQILRHLWIRNGGAVLYDRIGRFHEEKWRFPV